MLITNIRFYAAVNRLFQNAMKVVEVPNILEKDISLTFV